MGRLHDKKHGLPAYVVLRSADLEPLLVSVILDLCVPTISAPSCHVTWQEEDSQRGNLSKVPA